MQGVLALIMVMFLVSQAVAGTWTDHQFIYKPSLGARGEREKNTFDSGLDRVDTHLGRHKTLGDPGYETLANALTTIGTTNITLTIPSGLVYVTGNTTIPANVHLLILKGGKFNIADGITLTISGALDAGPYQVFSWTGTGKAVFGTAHSEIWADWWGTNEAALQAALTCAVNSATRLIIKSGRRTWTITNGITLNASFASLDLDGGILDGSGMSSGTILTITASAQQSSSMTSTRNIQILGPGQASSVIGLKFMGTGDQGSSMCHGVYSAYIRDCYVGVQLAEFAWLNRLYSSYIDRCAKGFYIPAGIGAAGENVGMTGGVIANCYVGVECAHAYTSLHFHGTSLDYNQAQLVMTRGQFFGTNLHIEGNNNSTPYTGVPFRVGDGALADEALIHLSNCVIANANQLADAGISHLFSLNMEEDDVGGVVLSDCYLYNTYTTSGFLATGTGRFFTKGLTFHAHGGSPETESVFSHSDKNLLSDGGHELASVVDALINADTSAITSRTDGANLDLAVSSTYARSGSQSLKATKTFGSGSEATFVWLVPIAGLDKIHAGQVYYKKAGAQTGTMYINCQYLQVLYFNQYGTPVYGKQGPNIMDTSVVFTSSPVDWTAWKINTSPTHLSTPTWATHFAITVNLFAVNAGDLYFDDALITAQ